MAKRALRKRGSLIVAVLVVLSLVVLMSSQTFQTLLLVRRGDSRQSTLRQARELIELGRMMRRQHPPAANFEPASIDVGDNQFGVISIEPVELEIVGDDSSSPAERSAEPGYRIVATFPAGTDREVTATWEGND